MIKKLSIFIFVLSLAACSPKEENKSVTQQRIEITPFKINKVMLRDTQLIKTIFLLSDSGGRSVVEYEEDWGKELRFLDYNSFNALRQSIWALVKNPGSRVYVNPTSNPSTSQEVKDRVVQCDMIEESMFDADGNEIIRSRMYCDSGSTIRNINQIRFFESWYFNPSNNMIERELLGYSVHEFVRDKNAFRELFDVFVNDAALEKARKYYFNKQAQ